jgi:hypothetical protein
MNIIGRHLTYSSLLTVIPSRLLVVAQLSLSLELVLERALPASTRSPATK